MKNKPSKRIIAFGIIAFAVVFGIAIYKFAPEWNLHEKINKILSRNSETKESDKLSVSLIEDKKILDKDTDNDGLKDWEEDLWGTDKNDKDSDKDGTSDGDEVKDNRNPLKSGLGADDKIKIDSKNSIVSNLPTASTTGSRLAKDLLTAAMVLKNSSKDPSVRDEAVNKLTNDISKDFKYEKYSKYDLVTINNATPAQIKAYGSAFALVQVNLLREAVDRNEEIGRDLNVFAKIYEKAAKALFKIPVPEEVVDLHIQAINTYSVANYAFQAFANSDKDPITFVSAINPFTEVSDRHEQLILAIATYLIKQNGIIYTIDEPGSYWNNFVPSIQ